MAFEKKTWQFNDIITEGELNRMEDGIEEGIAKAEQAEQIAQQSEQTANQTASDLAAHLADEASHGIGDKSTLLTTEKGTIVGAVNELFTSVSDGKNLIATAITDKGGTASGSDTFAELAAAISGMGAIKSIQHGVTALDIDIKIINVPISAVDMSKAVVFMSFKGSNITNGTGLFPVVRLTSSTNLNIERTTAANSITVSWFVVEFEGVKSVQRGDYALSTSGTITISAVNVSKAFLIISHKITTSTSNMGACVVAGNIENSTTIKIDSWLATANVHWQLVEFN